MIPVIIEDMIANVTNNKTHKERRQFYYTTLLAIKEKIDKAIKDYEREKNFR